MRTWIQSFLAIAVLAVALPASANLVANGGFETGDFTGWTQFGNTGFTAATGSPHSGVYGASFGPIGSTGGINQTLGTIAGQSYNISFWLGSDGGTPNSFSASFGGNPLTSLTNADYFPYTLYSFNETASSASSLLEFTFQQNPAFWHLDDVSVNPTSAVPGPPVLPLFALGLLAMAFLGRRRLWFARQS